MITSNEIINRAKGKAAQIKNIGVRSKDLAEAVSDLTTKAQALELQVDSKTIAFETAVEEYEESAYKFEKAAKAFKRVFNKNTEAPVNFEVEAETQPQKKGPYIVSIFILIGISIILFFLYFRHVNQSGHLVAGIKTTDSIQRQRIDSLYKNLQDSLLRIVDQLKGEQGTPGKTPVIHQTINFPTAKTATTDNSQYDSLVWELAKIRAEITSMEYSTLLNTKEQNSRIDSLLAGLKLKPGNPNRENLLQMKSIVNSINQRINEMKKRKRNKFPVRTTDLDSMTRVIDRMAQ